MQEWSNEYKIGEQKKANKLRHKLKQQAMSNFFQLFDSHFKIEKKKNYIFNNELSYKMNLQLFFN